MLFGSNRGTGNQIQQLAYTLDTGLESTELAPATVVQLRMEAEDGSKAPLPSSSGTVDQSGQIKLSLRMTGVNTSATNLVLVTCARKPKETSCVEQARKWKPWCAALRLFHIKSIGLSSRAISLQQSFAITKHCSLSTLSPA
jgi:hypothetical protein